MKKSIVIFILMLLTLPIIAMSSSPYIIEAKDMAFCSSDKTDIDDNIIMDSQGYMGTFVKVTKESKVKLTVTAKGESQNFLYPTLRFVSGKDFTRNILNAKDFEDYSYNFVMSPGIHFLRIDNLAFPGSQYVKRPIAIKRIFIIGSWVEVINKNDAKTILAYTKDAIKRDKKELVKITVKRKGKALPKARLTITTLKNNFYIGSWVSADSLEKPHYADFVKKYFTAITPENTGDWAFDEPEGNNVDLFRGVSAFAQKNNLQIRANSLLRKETLIFEIIPSDDTNKLPYREYNKELYQMPDVYSQEGDETNTDAYINASDAISTDKYANKYSEQIIDLLTNKIPISGIGIQYKADLSNHSVTDMFAALQNLAVFDKEIDMTSFGLESTGDFNIIQESLGLMLATPKSKGFMFKGFTDKELPGSALADTNYNLTSAGKLFEKTLSDLELNTKITGTTNKSGVLYIKVLPGKYAVTINDKTQTIDVDSQNTSHTIKL